VLSWNQKYIFAVEKAFGRSIVFQWEVLSGTLIRTWPRELDYDYITNIAISRDDKYLFTLQDSDNVKQWHILSGIFMREINIDPKICWIFFSDKLIFFNDTYVIFNYHSRNEIQIINIDPKLAFREFRHLIHLLFVFQKENCPISQSFSN